MNLENVNSQEMEVAIIAANVQAAIVAANIPDASGHYVVGTGRDFEAEKATPPTDAEAEEDRLEDHVPFKKLKILKTLEVRKSTRIAELSSNDPMKRKAATREDLARGRGRMRTRGGTSR